MKYKGTLIVVKDCNRALKFYSDMFGFQLLQDNDGNMELTNNIYLQESGYWEQFTKRSVIPNSNQSELYFEEPNIESADEFYPYTAKQLPTTENCHILDLGCGTGLELEEYFLPDLTLFYQYWVYCGGLRRIDPKLLWERYYITQLLLWVVFILL